METKKLRRSVNDSVIGGVSGGLGEYFDTDPVIFRILFVVLTLTGGGGVFIYLLMWIFIPRALRDFLNDHQYQKHTQHTSSFTSDANNQTSEAGEPVDKTTVVSEENAPSFKKMPGNLIGGAILILSGLFFLADDFFPWFNWEYLWPAALIVAGLAIIKINMDHKKV